MIFLSLLGELVEAILIAKDVQRHCNDPIPQRPLAVEPISFSKRNLGRERTGACCECTQNSNGRARCLSRPGPYSVQHPSGLSFHSPNPCLIRITRPRALAQPRLSAASAPSSAVPILYNCHRSNIVQLRGPSRTLLTVECPHHVVTATIPFMIHSGLRPAWLGMMISQSK